MERWTQSPPQDHAERGETSQGSSGRVSCWKESGPETVAIGSGEGHRELEIVHERSLLVPEPDPIRESIFVGAASLRTLTTVAWRGGSQGQGPARIQPGASPQESPRTHPREGPTDRAIMNVKQA